MTLLLPVISLADTVAVGPVYPALLFDIKVYFLVFGLVMILGGVMGYRMANSRASLIAGGVSGLLIIVGALMIPVGWQAGLVIEMLVCLALLGRFLPALLRGKRNPAGYVVPLSLIGAVLAIVLLCRIVVVHV